MALRLFGHVDELPALFDGGGGGHFHGHVLAALHGVGGHQHVGLPIGADIHQVDVVALAELAPGFTTRIGGGTWQSLGFQDVGLHGFHAVGLDVAQGDHGHTVDVGHAVDGIGTAHSEADEADADILNGVDGELKHTLLSLNALRLVEDDGVVHNAVVAFADFSFLFLSTGGGEGQ